MEAVPSHISEIICHLSARQGPVVLNLQPREEILRQNHRNSSFGSGRYGIKFDI